MRSPCTSCGSDRTVPLGTVRFCLACGGPKSTTSLPEIAPEIMGRLQAPADTDEAAEAVVVEMIEEVWNTAYSAGSLVAARAVRSEILSRPGRLRRLRELWPLTPTTSEEFCELLFLGASE